MSRVRLCDVVAAFVVGLLLLAAWKGLAPSGGEKAREYGHDFLQFYTAGLIVDRGEANRLYDHAHFRDLPTIPS